MHTQKKKKINKKLYFLFYPYMLLVLLALFTVASYTWFSLSKTPKVSNMNMYVNTTAGLELTHTPEVEDSWTQHVNYSDIMKNQPVLRPVTWSDREQCFYAAAYGADGRLLSLENWHKLSDERNANKTNYEAYYMKFTVYARCGTTADVTFFPAVSVNQDSEAFGTFLMGVPAFNLEEILHSDGGKGAQNAMRIGIRTSYLDVNLEPLDKDGEFFIYEPNCDGHGNGVTGYVPTPSIDGTETLVAPEYLIRQTVTTWGEVDPIVSGVVELDLGEFMELPTLFTITPLEIVQMDIYIWVEGQDIDCSNLMSKASILANLQFAGDAEAQTALRPIDGEDYPLDPINPAE